MWFTTRQTCFKNLRIKTSTGQIICCYKLRLPLLIITLPAQRAGVSYRPHVKIIQLPNVPPVCIAFKKIKRAYLAKDAPIFNLLLFLLHFLSLANYFERKLLFCQYDVWHTKHFKEMLARIHYE
jgi:hypothetical protein